MGHFFKGTGNKFQNSELQRPNLNVKSGINVLVSPLNKLEIIVATELDYYCKVN